MSNATGAWLSSPARRAFSGIPCLFVTSHAGGPPERRAAGDERRDSAAGLPAARRQSDCRACSGRGREEPPAAGSGVASSTTRIRHGPRTE